MLNTVRGFFKKDENILFNFRSLMPVVVDLMILVGNILNKRALGKILLLVSILLKGWREEKNKVGWEGREGGRDGS